jgi:hypothetical protein
LCRKNLRLALQSDWDEKGIDSSLLVNSLLLPSLITLTLAGDKNA